MRCALKNTSLDLISVRAEAFPQFFMNKPLPKHLQHIVETFCHKGCRNVNEIIEILTNNGNLEETSELSDDERKLVLNELRTIMSVYDQDD